MWAITNASGTILAESASLPFEASDLKGGEYHTFFRSAAKPFQTAMLLTNSSTIKQTLTAKELALACGSHVGSAAHVGLAHQILKKAEATEAALICGAHLPLCSQTQRQLKAKDACVSALHNNCSGQHATMLYLCHLHRWDKKTYHENDHPLQQTIQHALQALTSIQKTISVGQDGCGIPTFYMPLGAMAHCYARLASDENLKLVYRAMADHPYVFGGEGRIDSELTAVSKGRLVAKVGADGLICVANKEMGQGLAFKVVNGGERARNIAIGQFLLAVGWLKQFEFSDERLSAYNVLERYNTCGEAVGESRLI